VGYRADEVACIWEFRRVSPECWPRMRAFAFSYSPADSTPISLRRRCSRISSRRCSAFVRRRARAASRMCATSFAMKLRKSRNVPRPPVHSNNLAAPWVLDRLTFSVVLYTATSVANAHTLQRPNGSPELLPRYFSRPRLLLPHGRRRERRPKRSCPRDRRIRRFDPSTR